MVREVRGERVVDARGNALGHVTAWSQRMSGIGHRATAQGRHLRIHHGRLHPPLAAATQKLFRFTNRRLSGGFCIAALTILISLKRMEAMRIPEESVRTRTRTASLV